MWTIFLVVLLGLVPLEAKDKKPEPARQTYPKSRLINRSCQAVWSAAMPIMTELGFTPQTMERESGVAAFGFNRGSGEAYSTNDVRQLTTAPAGFWNTYTAFGIQSASLTVSPEVGACTCRIQINYVGFLRALMRGSGWVALESNGWFENNLLEKIQERAQISEGVIQAAKVEPKPAPPAKAEPVATVAQVVPVEPTRVIKPIANATSIVCPENVNHVPFSSSRPDRRTLACDEPITIVSEGQNFTRVKTADGLEGYVSPKFLGK